MDDRTREMYSSFTDMERVEALITYIDSVRDEMFILQQKLDYLQEEIGLSVNEVEVLQRKELWTQEEVCKYFSVNEITLRRGAESGDWAKPNVLLSEPLCVKSGMTPKHENSVSGAGSSLTDKQDRLLHLRGICNLRPDGI